MPRRSPLRRAATALLALLYLLAWGEPVALHPCPMHDGAGVAAMHAAPHAAPRGAPSTAPSTAPHAAHDVAMADMGATHHDAGALEAMAAGRTHAPADEHDAGHACQCLGHGCCAAAVIVPAAQQARWFVVVTRRADPPADAAPRAPARAAERLLPPATGPPVLG